jgi:cytochrome c
MTLPLVARKSVLMIASLAVPAMLLAQDYPPDLSRGKAVYERHCLSCHGTSGRGDGPAAASLRVAPANFQI